MSKKSEPFRVPTLAEADAEYAGLLEKRDELRSEEVRLQRDKRRLEREIAADPKPSIRPGVAELLGDVVAVDTRRADLAELRRHHADVDAALAIVGRRLSDVKGTASRQVREAIRPEYAKRVEALAEALDATLKAREAYQELCDTMEANGTEWTALGVLIPWFLGDRHDGHIHRWLRDAAASGYLGAPSSKENSR